MFSCCSRKVRAQERQAAVWQPYDLQGSNQAGDGTQLLFMHTSTRDYSGHWAGTFRVWAVVNGQLTPPRDIEHGKRVLLGETISLGAFSGVPSKLFIKLLNNGDNYMFDSIFAVAGSSRVELFQLPPGYPPKPVPLGGMRNGTPLGDLVAVTPDGADGSWEYTTPPTTTTPAPTTTRAPTTTPARTTRPAPTLPESESGVGEVKELRFQKDAGRQFKFVQQQDGNVILYDGTAVKWANNKAGVGHAPYKLVLQGDGNLVSYERDGGAIWSSGSRGNNCVLELQSDCNVVIYGDDGQPKWSTGTVGV